MAQAKGSLRKNSSSGNNAQNQLNTGEPGQDIAELPMDQLAQRFINHHYGGDPTLAQFYLAEMTERHAHAQAVTLVADTPCVHCGGSLDAAGRCIYRLIYPQLHDNHTNGAGAVTTQSLARQCSGLIAQMSQTVDDVNELLDEIEQTFGMAVGNGR